MTTPVTILAYHFWGDEGYETAFAKMAHAFEEAWRFCGALRSVLVVNAVKPCVEAFAAARGGRSDPLYAKGLALRLPLIKDCQRLNGCVIMALNLNGNQYKNVDIIDPGVN